MKKFTYVTSVSPGYMFALNCNFNANKFYGTNADYVVIYDSFMKQEQEYMDQCSKAFPFEIKWVYRGDYVECYHSCKYAVAQTLQNEYEAICLIDSDLFICTNTLEYFERAANENVLITATHLWSGGNPDGMDWGHSELCGDRIRCQLADFPVFINPNFGHQLFVDWKNGTTDGVEGSEWQHPLVTFNRAVCKNLKREQVVPLPGEFWVCDNNYWAVNYTVGIGADGKLHLMTDVHGEKQEVKSNHNKWWKEGRSSGEWLAHRWAVEQNNQLFIGNLNRGEKNFNVIRDFMMMFNDMTPSTKRVDFYSGKHDWKKYLETGVV